MNKQEMSKAIGELFSKGEWETARTILLEWQKEESDNHWVVTRIGTTYYEQKDYEKALEYDQQGIKLMPRCPLVLWDYASTLDMLGREEEAIEIWKSLIRKGALAISRDKCGEGIRRSRALVNDSLYRIGSAYADIGNTHLAKRYIREHIRNRGRNCPSIYNLRDVKTKLATI